MAPPILSESHSGEGCKNPDIPKRRESLFQQQGGVWTRQLIHYFDLNNTLNCGFILPGAARGSLMLMSRPAARALLEIHDPTEKDIAAMVDEVLLPLLVATRGS
jgi:hypothetical protein